MQQIPVRHKKATITDFLEITNFAKFYKIHPVSLTV